MLMMSACYTYMSTCLEVDDHEPKVKCVVHCMLHSIMHYWVQCTVHHIVIDYQQHEVELP